MVRFVEHGTEEYDDNKELNFELGFKAMDMELEERSIDSFFRALEFPNFQKTPTKLVVVQFSAFVVVSFADANVNGSSSAQPVNDMFRQAALIILSETRYAHVVYVSGRKVRGAADEQKMRWMGKVLMGHTITIFNMNLIHGWGSTIFTVQDSGK